MVKLRCFYRLPVPQKKIGKRSTLRTTIISSVTKHLKGQLRLQAFRYRVLTQRFLEKLRQRFTQEIYTPKVQSVVWNMSAVLTVLILAMLITLGFFWWPMTGSRKTWYFLALLSNWLLFAMLRI